MKLALGNTLSSNKPGGGRSTALIVDAFKRRVEARDGVFEAKSCLTTQLNAIKNIA
tara:strand:+ start:1064 stop:1231 length:168 start_codon:yes stop_codon:yes gene_type:complete